MADDRPLTWFADREANVLLYKVNRRPRPQMTMWEYERDPSDAFEQFAAVLPFGTPVTTGRRFRRTWYLGDKSVMADERVVYGQIGWQQPKREEAARVTSNTNDGWMLSRRHRLGTMRRSSSMDRQRVSLFSSTQRSARQRWRRCSRAYSTKPKPATGRPLSGRSRPCSTFDLSARG